MWPASDLQFARRQREAFGYEALRVNARDQAGAIRGNPAQPSTRRQTAVTVDADEALRDLSRREGKAAGLANTNCSPRRTTQRSCCLRRRSCSRGAAASDVVGHE